MSAEEFVDWQLYYEMNPFGSKRDDIQAAMIASTVANVNAPKGKRYRLKDFLPEFKSQYAPKPTMDNAQILATFQELADAQKGPA